MINNNYTLFAEIPILKDRAGKLYCDSLWAKDLNLHAKYILNFSLCCPIQKIENPAHIHDLEKHFPSGFAGVTEITDLSIKHIYELNMSGGWISVFLNIIPNFIKVAKVAKVTEIAHSSGAGWPFPLSYYLFFLRPFYNFKWIVLIESAFFLVTKDESFNLRRFIGHHLHTVFLRACVKSADARIFLTEQYKNYFLKGNDRALVAGITWLESNLFIKEEELQIKVDKADDTLKLILAGRLIVSKGIKVLLNAINKLEESYINVQIDIMGSGDLEAECRRFIEMPRNNVKMAFIDSAQYGKPFLDKLRQYDVVLLPSLSDEQPRIIYDAFSQGVGIIGSNTPGIKGVCKDGVNAILFEAGSTEGLFNAIKKASSNITLVREMGKNGLQLARLKTHHQMHVDREKFLISVLKLSA